MFSTLTSHERQVRTEFVAGVDHWHGAVVGGRFPTPKGGSPTLELDVRLANRALDAGFSLGWVVETLVRRQLARTYGTGLVTAATATTTERTRAST